MTFYPHADDETWTDKVDAIIPSVHTKYRASLLDFLSRYPELTIEEAATRNGTTSDRLRTYLFNMCSLTPKKLAEGEYTLEQLEEMLVEKIKQRKKNWQQNKHERKKP